MQILSGLDNRVKRMPSSRGRGQGFRTCKGSAVEVRMQRLRRSTRLAYGLGIIIIIKNIGRMN